MKKKDHLINTDHIGKMLDRLKSRLIPPQASVEKVVLEVIKEVLGLELTSKQVTYQPASRTIVIHAPSLIKTEIKRRQVDILKSIQTKLVNKNYPTTLL